MLKLIEKQTLNELMAEVQADLLREIRTQKNDRPELLAELDALTRLEERLNVRTTSD